MSKFLSSWITLYYIPEDFLHVLFFYILALNVYQIYFYCEIKRFILLHVGIKLSLKVLLSELIPS